MKIYYIFGVFVFVLKLSGSERFPDQSVDGVTGVVTHTKTGTLYQLNTLD